MSATALVIVHAQELDVSAINAFHEAMDGLDFMEVPNIPMAWAAHYPEGSVDEHGDVIRREAVDAAHYAAKKAGLASFSLAVQIGPTTPAVVTERVELSLLRSSNE